MKDGFRQSMAWLHTWVGLVAGWVLFFIFVTGSLGYFYVEIDRWMRPELPLASRQLTAEEATAQADSFLRHAAPDADFWLIQLPTDRETALSVVWGTGSLYGRDRQTRVFDPAAGHFVEEPKARDTQGGYGLYRMHWKLHYLPQAIGILVVGLCAMLMFLAIPAGVIAHKRIFADFFTFRPRKGQRSWLDLHNLMSVTALPFFVMITYSGLVFYMESYVPSGVSSLFAEPRAYWQELESERPEIKRSSIPAAMPPLEGFRRAAHQQWGKGDPQRIVVRLPGDTNAEVSLVHAGNATTLRNVTEKLHFGGADGRLREVESARSSGPRATRSVLFGLHEGIFAGWPLRWLYFLSGLLGCGMVATGLILWTVKRRAKLASGQISAFGFRLVECLNIGTLAGLPVAIGAFFLANRLLPVDLPNRAAWEFHALFIVWGAMLLWASVRPSAKAWVEILWIAAGALVLLSFVNALTTDRHLGVSLPAGDWGLASVDLAALVAGTAFAATARHLRRRTLPRFPANDAASRTAEAMP